MEARKELSEESLKKPWQHLRKSYTGQVARVVQGGGGKLSPQAGDPGDDRKQSGTG